MRRQDLKLLVVPLLLLLALRIAKAAPVGFATAADGTVALEQGADDAFNPASVVKTATSWWALESLGRDHRFLTRFVREPSSRIEDGVLHGDLWVLGGNDPDFQSENAWRAALALGRCGIRRVTGTLRVIDGFWIGWEGGSEARPSTPAARRHRMAERLADAWNSSAWTTTEKRRYKTWAEANDSPTAPSLLVGGVDESTTPPPQFIPIVDHRGNQLVDTLRRFNTYSNNDLERLGDTLGSPQALSSFIARHTPKNSFTARLETLSGLGSNRWSPRAVVTLLRGMELSLQDMGLELESVLPVPGCGPGTLERYRRLGEKSHGRLVAKTGTLVQTDGGVSVIAGRVRDRDGSMFFCLAETAAGKDIAAARTRIESRLLALMSTDNLEPGFECGPPLPDADSDIQLRSYTADARIETIARSTKDGPPVRSMKPQ